MDELERDPPRGGHALMELGDLQTIGDAVVVGVLLPYVVRGRSTAK